MTFDPTHVLPWVWQEVKGEAVSVNEADYHCLEFAVSRAERKAATSGPVSGVLCYNEDLSRQKPHLLIMGYKRGVVGLHATLLRYLTWLGVVSFSCHLHVSEQP